MKSKINSLKLRESEKEKEKICSIECETHVNFISAEITLKGRGKNHKRVNFISGNYFKSREKNDDL